MKDETSGMFVKDYVGLKSKIYTLIAANNHESNKAKGINQNFLDIELKSENYTNILFNRSSMRHEMNRIQSKDLNIGSCKVSKLSLSTYSQKIYT